ncbi:MAG: cation:proton antiporter [Candidatus Lokiarchaeota archaeon]
MDLNIFLFLGAIFLLTYLIGMLIEKIHIPWIFAALILGFVLAIYNPFSSITSSSTFDFLSQLGMYFLLFIIGFEIDLKQMKKMGKLISKFIRFNYYKFIFCYCRRGNLNTYFRRV